MKPKLRFSLRGDPPLSKSNILESRPFQNHNTHRPRKQRRHFQTEEHSTEVFQRWSFNSQHGLFAVAKLLGAGALYFVRAISQPVQFKIHVSPLHVCSINIKYRVGCVQFCAALSLKDRVRIEFKCARLIVPRGLVHYSKNLGVCFGS